MLRPTPLYTALSAAALPLHLYLPPGALQPFTSARRDCFSPHHPPTDTWPLTHIKLQLQHIFKQKLSLFATVEAAPFYLNCPTCPTRRAAGGEGVVAQLFEKGGCGVPFWVCATHPPLLLFTSSSPPATTMIILHVSEPPTHQGEES